MTIDIAKRIGWFAALALLQALLFNRIHLFGVATPLVYLHLILILPQRTSRNAHLLWGFLLGLTVDIFSDTPGMHAAATKLVAFLRPQLHALYMPRDASTETRPSSRGMGFTPYARYAATTVLVHHALFFLLEVFSFAHLGIILAEVFASSLLTIATLLALDSITKK